MLHRFTTVTILLGLIIQYSEGFERVIVVSESDVISNEDSNAIGSDSGSNVFDNPCCIFGNCSCPSLYNALANLTSNVLINITTDVVLSSIIPLVDLADVTITGHHNPTVNCNNSGGLHFMSCHNCTIEGITWNGCGASNDDNVYPVLQLFNSSNITIKNCSFQHSIGQAVVLSEMIGDMNIEHCKFSSNKQYEGHGTAIHYSSNNVLTGPPVTFIISGCHFLHNERAKSVVYFGPSSSVKSCEYLSLQNSNFYHNRGVPVYLSNQNLCISGILDFYNNSVENGGGMFISDYSNVTFHDNATVNFTHNTANNNGGAIFLTNHSSILFKEHPTLNKCHNNELVGPLDSTQSQSLTVIFDNNRVNGLGHDIYAHNNSDIAVNGTAHVMFNGCRHCASNAVYINYHCAITFEGNSNVTFNGYGGVMHIDFYSNITFQGNTEVTVDSSSYFYYNGLHGGAMYIHDDCTITFQENSTVSFIGNSATNGGVMYIDSSTVTFQGNSVVTFYYNMANNGGVMYVYFSTVTFQENTNVTFGGNHADGNGGVMYTEYSPITFQGNSTAKFYYNDANFYGGALYISGYTDRIFTFRGNSTVTFCNNEASYKSLGGAILITFYATIKIEDNSTVILCNNSAYTGGAIVIDGISTISVTGNAIVTCYNNEATIGGVMFIDESSTVTFEGNSTVTFYDYQAVLGGALYIYRSSTVTFQENSKVTFYDSQEVHLGGAMYIYDNSTIAFKENSNVTFNNNAANLGGVTYIHNSSAITFEDNCKVTFTNNYASGQGGVIYIVGYSAIAFKGNSVISFCNNKVDDNGGSLYVDNNSTVEFKENSTILFNGNKADSGGAIFSKSSSIFIVGNSFVRFSDNIASRDGGAIYLSDQSNFTQLNNSNVTFCHNSASDYGGAVYTLLKDNLITFNSSGIYFIENIARTIQSSVYINILQNTYENDSLILNQSVNIANNIDIPLATSPNTLVLYNPAKCIDANCDNYYMNNIMLGQEITFDACVLDYYSQPTEAIQFSVTGMDHQDYTILGQKYISISCNRTIQGMSVNGSLQPNTSYNYSVNISLYVTRASEFKIIFVNLIVELSQCHPGFQYSNDSQKCECYDVGNVITCSGSNSTIKRGYWFGNVTGKPTVASCPNGYCNFTCCEISNGIYQLSPVRANQCRPHRSGTACGNCEVGYTLSFDSPQCVEVSKCTIGAALVTTLSLLYWVAVVVAVFAMTHFKVTIGSLYAIIYYYSVMDILLSRVLFISNGLYTTVSIMSSFAKLTPQFLGQLCLVKNLSGIDQQFIHYVHPLVVLFILIIISLLARKSRRISSFVSRGIIQFLCFLLLLSYTSLATTSLLLMRPLRFADIDKVYTYLSPDIEYFHDRHAAYITIAIIFTIVVVIGFPFLLLSEPFLNSKINFIKIKPLLDQFQGCYKDKHRCFAGYYMICRLVIILLVIIPDDNFTTKYLLMSSCALMQLIHVLVKPYVSTIHNIFDGIILQLIVIIAVLPIVDFVDIYDETFVVVVIYLLVILPLLSFIAIKVWINRNDIQKSFKHLINIEISTNDRKETVQMREFDTVVDDELRRKLVVHV